MWQTIVKLFYTLVKMFHDKRLMEAGAAVEAKRSVEEIKSKTDTAKAAADSTVDEPTSVWGSDPRNRS
jgi:hypothetical protein|tara:strand:- start:289 stop:492 length:204 start_codon:yes stop_codon:yes gene_type:complete